MLTLGSLSASGNYEGGGEDERSMISLTETLSGYLSRQNLQDSLMLGGMGQNGCILIQRE